MKEIHTYINNILSNEREIDKPIGIIATEFDNEIIKTRIALHDVNEVQLAYVVIMFLKSIGELETLRNVLNNAAILEKTQDDILDCEENFKLLWKFTKYMLSSKHS